ncbi:MAG TPA: diacylglycerol kinase family protein [Candidatus Paceibacterota bacterium]|nr:diacylglycerol kinase family protein [Candidatus Paceibacterota bacterium]
MKYCFKLEKNLTLILIIAIIVIIIGGLLHISHTEWLFVITLIIAILALELFNTSIEHFLDLFHPEINNQVKHIKDLMAGSVAIVSLGALILGIIIFLPKILKLINAIN